MISQPRNRNRRTRLYPQMMPSPSPEFEQTAPPPERHFDDDEDSGATHPSLPHFRDREPINGVLIYDEHGHEQGTRAACVVTNVSTSPRLPRNRIVLNVEGIASLCFSPEQSAALRADLLAAELDAAPALALAGGGQ